MDDGAEGFALVVRARRLRAARGVTVAREVELTAAAGEVVAVEGANGSGKSTLLAAAAGLLPTGAGSRRPASVGYAPERADMLTRLSLRRWLTGLARTAGLPRAEAVRQVSDLIQRLGLTAAAEQPMRALSRGNTQRALVAQALIGPPRLVVLDEPSGGLDADGLARVAGEIERLAEQDSVVLVARHPTARVPLPPGPAWRVENGTVTVVDRPAQAAGPATEPPEAETGDRREADREGRVAGGVSGLVEVETGDGVVRQVGRGELSGVLRVALDAGIEIRRVQPVVDTGAAAAGSGAAGARRAEGLGWLRQEDVDGTAGAGVRRAGGMGRRRHGGAAGGGVRWGGGLGRVVWGAGHRGRLLAVSQWFAAPALLFFALLGVVYSAAPFPAPPPLTSPALTAIALAPVMTWLSVLAQTVDGPVVGRAFVTHVGGPARARLATCVAVEPFGIIASIAAVLWPVLTGWPGHWGSIGFLAQVAALQLGAVVFGTGVGALLVPPLVQTTGWRVCLGVAVYLALILLPASPMRPMLRLSAGSLTGGGAAVVAAGWLAGLGVVLIAAASAVADRLP